VLSETPPSLIPLNLKKEDTYSSDEYSAISSALAAFGGLFELSIILK